MRRATFLLSAAALVLASPDAFAQGKPSFAGKWTAIVDSTAAAPTGRGGGRGGLGQAPTITQDDKTLTITRTTQAGETKTVYNLDGSESKNTVTMGGGNSIEQVSKAKWDGDKLVITTTFNVGGEARESTLALSLDASGNLVAQSTGVGRGGGAPTTTTTTYKKG